MTQTTPEQMIEHLELAKHVTVDADIATAIIDFITLHSQADADLTLVYQKGVADGKRLATSGWQDIASAPRDGSEVLTYQVTKYGWHIQLDWYDADSDKHWLTGTTHWMPLPPPPEKKGE